MGHHKNHHYDNHDHQVSYTKEEHKHYSKPSYMNLVVQEEELAMLQVEGHYGEEPALYTKDAPGQYAKEAIEQYHTGSHHHRHNSHHNQRHHKNRRHHNRHHNRH